jgi:hypothetical protein
MTSAGNESTSDAAHSDNVAAEAPEGAPTPGRMTPKEQRIGWALAAVVAAAVLIAWIPDTVAKDNQGVGIAAGLAFAALLAGAVWYGRRVITSFASILAGFTPPPRHGSMKALFVYVPLLSLIYGGLLFIRHTKARKKALALQPRRSPSEAREARAKARAAARTGTRPARGRGRSGSAASTPSDRPAANRRYTPPKTKPSRPGR